MNPDRPRTGNLITGSLILVVYSLFFLLRSLHVINVTNWWAIFILIPAFSAIGNLWDEINLQKSFSFSHISAISGVLFPLVITLIFFLNFSWVEWYPLLILIAGLILLLSAFLQDRSALGIFARSLRGWFISGGLAVLLVGILVFFFNPLMVDPRPIPPFWLGSALLLLASGSLIQIMTVQKPAPQNKLSSMLNLIVGFWFFVPGVLSLTGYQPGFFLSILLLAVGSLVIGFLIYKTR